MRKILIAPKDDVGRDSLTHGNYTQLIYATSRDTLIICRAATFPIHLLLLGLYILMLVTMIALVSPHDAIRWDRIYGVGFFASMMCVPALFQALSPFRFLVQLYPELHRGADDRFERTYLDG